uniref:Uncharacterized protein n=1 Tax=Plectus sambesii TaxID=2011161 RepID=A0A914XMH9_9BILA
MKTYFDFPADLRWQIVWQIGAPCALAFRKEEERAAARGTNRQGTRGRVEIRAGRSDPLQPPTGEKELMLTSAPSRALAVVTLPANNWWPRVTQIIQLQQH